LRRALEKIACRHVTENPLWWQLEARAALSSEGQEKKSQSSDGGSRERPFALTDAVRETSAPNAPSGKQEGRTGIEVGASQTPGSSMSFGPAQPIVAGQAPGPSEATALNEGEREERELMVIRKRAAEFIWQNDPFGDSFSRHELGLLKGDQPTPVTDPYEAAARNAGWVLIPDEFGGIFERSASDESERVHFNGDWKQLCEFAGLEVAHD
jgi:hypothetical protein